MKRVQVTPLREVNGVNFGDTQATVRRTFGIFKESKGYDDFRWCKVFYDQNRRMNAIELNLTECTVTVGSNTINPYDGRRTRNSFQLINNVDKKRGMVFTETANNRLSSVTFGKQGNTAIFESDDKELTELVGKDQAQKQIEAEKNQHDQNLESMKASSNKVKDDVRKAIGDDKSPVKKEDGSESLLQFYDDLKNRLNSDAAGTSDTAPMKVTGGTMNFPNTMMYRTVAQQNCNQLKDDCCKHIILDMYCRILPLDQSYIAGNMGSMKSDVDGMLAAKGMTPTQYITSCSQATKAPLLEFVVRSVNKIGEQFMEAANDKLKDAKEQDIAVEAPEVPDVNAEPTGEDDVASQLIDIEKDSEYENFIDKLKEKTIKKIVSDITKIINDKKEDSEMVFDPKPDANSGVADVNTMNDLEAKTESTFSIGLQYLQKQYMTEAHHQDMTRHDNEIFGGRESMKMMKKEGSDKDPGSKVEDQPHNKKIVTGGTDLHQDNSDMTEEIFESDITDQLIGLAIREATLNELDRCFNQHGSSFREFANRVRLGNGYVINKKNNAKFFESLIND